MEKEEIKREILKLLRTILKDGGKSSQIVEYLGFIEGRGDAHRTYKLLKEMREDGTVRYFEIGKMIIHYLKENEKEVRSKWKHYLILNNIDCGYLLIHQGFFTKKEGYLLNLEGYVFDEKLACSDWLDRVATIEDDSDFLFFWIHNKNAISIDKIIVRFYVVPSYFKLFTNKNKVTYGCDYKIDYGNIEITCESLFPKGGRAYTLIPVERLNKHMELAEDIPELKVWYDNYPIDHIKGGEVTTNSSGGKRIILE